MKIFLSIIKMLLCKHDWFTQCIRDEYDPIKDRYMRITGCKKCKYIDIDKSETIIRK